jgi:hypothetical protein
VPRFADDQAFRLRASLDDDLLLDRRQRLLLALELIGVPVDSLDVQVHHVRHRVRERPCDVVVLTHHHPWQAGEGGAPAVPITEVEPDLVDDPRHAWRQVRVAGHERSAGSRSRLGDGPVVGAGGLDGQPNRVTHLGDLLDQAQAVALPGLTGRDHDGITARVAGIQAGGQLRAQLPRHLGTQKLSLPIGREAKREELGEGECIRRREGLEVQPEELELERRRAIGCGRVDPGAQRLELGAQPRLERRRLPLGGPSQPHRAHESIRLQPGTPSDLGQPAGADAPVQVDLPEAVLAMAEPLTEPQVVPRSGGDVRNPPAVPPNLDPPLQPRKLQAALGAGQRAPEKLPPKPSGCRRGQRREAPAEERKTPRQRAAQHGRQL